VPVFNPSKGLNVANSNFGRRPGRRQVEARTPWAPVRCGECTTFHQRTHCPECGEVPREAWVSVLYSQVETEGGDRLAVAAERAEDGSWSPIQVERVGDLDHGTRWGPT
jgi:hypothetical protein